MDQTIFVYAYTFLTLLLPLPFLLLLRKERRVKRIDWWLSALIFAMVLILVFFAGAWGHAGIYTKWGITAFYFLFAFRIWIKRFYFSQKKVSARFLKRSVKTIIVLFLLAVNLLIIRTIPSYYPSPTAEIDLNFPLGKGKYVCIQGGDNPITNYFHGRIPSEKFALDIVKVNNFGVRAKGIYPQKLDNYFIFNDTVYSPCDGTVEQARGYLQDNMIGYLQPKVDFGNHVIIRQNEYEVLLCHFKKYSLMVKNGDNVKKGQPIALIGNSGYSVEPHLHISVKKKVRNSVNAAKVAVSFTFDGKPMYLNAIKKIE